MSAQQLVGADAEFVQAGFGHVLPGQTATWPAACRARSCGRAPVQFNWRAACSSWSISARRARTCSDSICSCPRGLRRQLRSALRASQPVGDLLILSFALQLSQPPRTRSASAMTATRCSASADQRFDALQRRAAERWRSSSAATMRRCWEAVCAASSRAVFSETASCCCATCISSSSACALLLQRFGLLALVRDNKLLLVARSSAVRCNLQPIGVQPLARRAPVRIPAACSTWPEVMACFSASRFSSSSALQQLAVSS